MSSLSIKQLIFALVSLWLLAAALVLSGSVSYLGTAVSPILSHDIRLDYFIGVGWASLLWGSILLWPVSSHSKKHLLILWGFKVLITLFGMLLYEKYVPTIDTIGYFDPNQYFQQYLSNYSWHNGASNVAFLTQSLRSLLFSYHAVKVTFAMVGFLGIFIFYQAACYFFQKKQVLLLYLMSGYPTLLLFPSMIGKESLILLGIAIYFYGACKLSEAPSWSSLSLLVLGMGVLVLVRMWTFILFTIALGGLLMLSKWPKANYLKGVALVVVLTLMVTRLPTLTIWAGDWGDKLAALNDYRVRMFYGTNLAYAEAPPFQSYTEVLYFFPKGAFTSLFRPMFGERFNLLGLLGGVESLFLMIWFFIALLNWQRCHFRNRFLIWMIAIVFGWASLHAFVSYNFGPIIRARVEILPFMFTIFFYLTVVNPKYAFLSSLHSFFLSKLDKENTPKIP